MGFFDRFRGKPKSAPPAAPADGGRAVFAAEFEALLRSDKRLTEIEPLADDYGFSMNRGGEPLKAYLENHFLETRDLTPDARAARLRFVLASFFNESEMPETLAEVRANLRAVLRPGTFGMSTDAQVAKMRFCRKEAVAGLSQILVVDRPQSMGYLGAEQLPKWEIDEEQAHAIAIENVAALPKPLELYDSLHGPLFHSPGEDDYASSWLLVPGFLASCASRVEGRPIAIVPEKTALFIGGDARPEMLLRLAQMAQREYQAAARKLSCAVYTVDESGAVVPYPATGFSAWENEVRFGHDLLAAYEYQAQAQWLEARNAAQGRDVFVAKFTLMRTPDGRPWTYAAWAEGVTGSLPRARYIFIQLQSAPPGQDLLVVRPDDLLRLGGAIVTAEALEYGPARLATRGELSQAQKEALHAVRVTPDKLAS